MPMTLNEFQQEALRTARDDSTKDTLINGSMGLCGEAGEVIDLIKKAFYQGHKLDKERIAEELGDLFWYLAVTADALDYTLTDIALINIRKREKRYPDGFSEERSVNRNVYEKESEHD